MLRLSLFLFLCLRWNCQQIVGKMHKRCEREKVCGMLIHLVPCLLSLYGPILSLRMCNGISVATGVASCDMPRKGVGHTTFKRATETIGLLRG
jgi:hypothetical protein